MQQTLLPDSADPPKVIVYTDGGCDPNPGPGGWAAILRFSNREVVLAGNAAQTTNNRMEMEAAIAALAYLNGQYGPCQFDLYTDSQYLRQGITQWIDGWFARGWKTKNGQPVKNQALWRKLYNLIQVHRVRWHWVRGHVGDPLNERVDRLATEARNGLLGVDAHPPVLPSPASSHSSPGLAADRSSPQVEISIGVSCFGSTGGGGWAAVLRSDQMHKVLCGHEEQTTSNVLLLKAAIEGLKALKRPCNVTVYTVSDYLGKGASQWVHGWQQRQWRTKQGGQVKNREHWEVLLEAARNHRVSWQVVRGKEMPDVAEAKEVATQQAAL